MTVHIHRDELHADWADSMADWGAANAAELKHFTGHRALPLEVVEQKSRDDRVAWPNVCPECNVGTQGDCDCVESVHIVDRVQEEHDEDQSVSADAEVGMAIVKFVGVILLAAFAVWLVAGGPGSDALPMLATKLGNLDVF